MPIPVYAFTGFLDAGKTKFIQETLCDTRFNAGERTLLLLCEEGEVELDPAAVADGGKCILTDEFSGDKAVRKIVQLLKQNASEQRETKLSYNGVRVTDREVFDHGEAFFFIGMYTVYSFFRHRFNIQNR